MAHASLSRPLMVPLPAASISPSRPRLSSSFRPRPCLHPKRRQSQLTLATGRGRRSPVRLEVEKLSSTGGSANSGSSTNASSRRVAVVSVASSLAVSAVAAASGPRAAAGATSTVPSAVTSTSSTVPRAAASTSSVVPSAAASEALGSTASSGLPPPAKVFVAGATGKTGQRIVRSLTRRGIRVQGGVRDVGKAKGIFADVEPALLNFVEFDVLKDPNTLSAAIDPSSEAIIVATGFSPPSGGFPNLLEPWQVDCTGTQHVVDAARQLGIPRLVLVSSILTNGAAWGQALNPNYLILNLFGLILIAKLQAEQYIQRSGINYTIVRPGGLKNDPPTGNIVASSQDTLSSGAISRDSVAEVAVESLLWDQASFKIVEIVEETSAPSKSFEEMFASLK